MSTEYHNPIIPGFAPDPSIAFVNGTFFLVNSSFHVFPGLPIYASEDLISWRQIGVWLYNLIIGSVANIDCRKCVQQGKPT